MQQVVERDDLEPVGLLPRRRRRVAGGDRGLQLVAARIVEGGGPLEHRLAGRDPRGVPERAVLVAEQHQPAVAVEAGGGPGVLDGEQRGQPPGLGRPRQRGGHDPGQPDGVGGEVAVLGGAGGGHEALVEHHVDDGEHVAEAVREVGLVGHGQRDPGRHHLLLRAHDPLGEGGLVDQERPGDLRGRETDHGAQRQREPRLGRQGRVAAREEQCQPVVGGGGVRTGARGRGPGPLGEPALPHGPAYGVERVALCGDGEPGGGVVGRAVAPPGRHGLEHGRLDGLLGEVEVAVAAGEPGHQRTRLLAQHLREEGVHGDRGRSHPSNCE